MQPEARGTRPPREALLEVNDLVVSYGAIGALKGITLSVGKGEVVALIGANGAGKTSTLRAVSGLVRPSKGSIKLAGADITGLKANLVVAKGLAHAPEGRGIFANLTVDENLQLGAYLRRDHAAVAKDRDHALGLFPRLRERLQQSAGTLSGGELQMLAIARALLARPKLLLLDEPSLGLAPLIVKQIFEVIREINQQQGVTVFLVEQNAHHALKLAHRGYVMVNGLITLSGTGRDLLANPEVRAAYLEGGHG